MLANWMHNFIGQHQHCMGIGRRESGYVGKNMNGIGNVGGRVLGWVIGHIEGGVESSRWLGAKRRQGSSR
jgi:hypothetical protein